MTTAQTGALAGSLIIPFLLILFNIKDIRKIKYDNKKIYNTKSINLISNLLLLILLIGILYIQIESRKNSHHSLEDINGVIISIFTIASGLFLFMRNNEL